MSKLAGMKKKLVLQGIIALAIVSGFGVAMMAADSMSQSAIQQKTDLETALRGDENEMRELKSKIELAEGAEKSFAEIAAIRAELAFEAKTEHLVQLLQDAKNTYRLSGFKPLNLPVEAISKLTEFNNASYNVTVRDGVGIEFDAISDVHAQAFIQHLLSRAPGFLVIKSLDMQRKDDLSAQAILQLQGGQTLGIVNTKLQLIWAGVVLKPDLQKANVPGSAP